MILNKKILLVDDDKSIINMLDVILRKEQFSKIYKAETGENAIKCVKEVQPDLVILDIMLPDMDGYEVCKQIRLDSMVPILFLSAKSDEVDKLVQYCINNSELNF